MSRIISLSVMAFINFAFSSTTVPLPTGSSITGFADMTQYIPNTPSARQVNCHLEITSLMQVPGECVRLGRNFVYGCQSGVYLQVNSPECLRLSRYRTETAPKSNRRNRHTTTLPLN